MLNFETCNDPRCDACTALKAATEYEADTASRAYNIAKEVPVTGTGDGPVKEIVINLPLPNPETVADYMEWVKLRTANLGRWVKADTADVAPLILETIARIEGDLQQMRQLVKGTKDTADRVDDILTHLTAFSIEALDKIMDANGENE
jgi:hypothetical protein